MVGLSDIPCVGVAVQRTSEATVDAATRGLRYTLCYNTVIQELNSEIENVKKEEVLVSRRVDAAKNDGKIIEEYVLKWQEEVKNMKATAADLSKQTTSCTCFNIFPFPNPVSRFRVGRKAAKQSKTVAEHTASGKDLLAAEVGYLPAVENLPTSDTDYHSFASREDAYKKLWEALVDENGDPILAIYGMPGVGKTRTMEQAWKDAKDKNIFKKVVRVNVSGEKLNVINLQDKLASFLDCHLESQNNEQHRASQLSSSLMQGGKTLVILDDVWDVIPLNKVGIPFGDGSSKGCKILLTSRKQDVCLRNNCNHPIEIKTLTESEAWEMFRKTVGSSTILKLNDRSLANKVCKKCADLPLAIQAVGNALRCATENLWIDALDQLENSKLEEIEGIDEQVYACLRLSFEKLGKPAKGCIFLCSLFREDHDIEIQMLYDLATGSQLLDRERNIYAVVDILRSSSLLLHDEDHDTVKLHDIIRDTARSLASKDPEYAFLSLKCSSRLPDNVKYPSLRLLQLELEEDNVCFPDDLLSPDLHTLWLRGNNNNRKSISAGFFKRFSNLKVLILQGMIVDGDHIHSLEKLGLVILDNCHIYGTFFSSVSGSLETMCIRKCSHTQTLDLPDLKKFRKLELLDNDEFYIVEGSISSLSSLEELRLVGKFLIQRGQYANVGSIFPELSQLTRFKSLMLDLDSSVESYPDEDVLNKLVKFSIEVRPRYAFRNTRDLSKHYICLIEVDIEDGWMGLVERAEIVVLETVEGFVNGFSDSNMREANLRELTIDSVHDMKHVASLEGRNQQLPSCFSNLTIVKIGDCSKLKYLFSSSVAKSLQKMQYLFVAGCVEIEEIIRTDEGITEQGETILCFPNLKRLDIWSMHSLTTFSTLKVKFPNIERLTLEYLHSSFSTQNIELGRDDSPPTLKTLYIDFPGQDVELPSQWVHQLQNVKDLEVRGCRRTADSVLKRTLIFERIRELESRANGESSGNTEEHVTKSEEQEEKQAEEYDHDTCVKADDSASWSWGSNSGTEFEGVEEDLAEETNNHDN